MLEKCYNHSKQCRNNAVMLCCAKNLCCELCNITLKVMLHEETIRNTNAVLTTFVTGFLHMAPIRHNIWDGYDICNQFLIIFCTNYYIWDLNRALVFFPLI